MRQQLIASKAWSTEIAVSWPVDPTKSRQRPVERIAEPVEQHPRIGNQEERPIDVAAEVAHGAQRRAEEPDQGQVVRPDPRRHDCAEPIEQAALEAGGEVDVRLFRLSAKSLGILIAREERGRHFVPGSRVGDRRICAGLGRPARGGRPCLAQFPAIASAFVGFVGVAALAAGVAGDRVDDRPDLRADLRPGAQRRFRIRALVLSQNAGSSTKRRIAWGERLGRVGSA